MPQNATGNSSLSLLDIVLNNGTFNGTLISEQEAHDQWQLQFDQALADYTRVVLRAMRDNFIEHSILFDDERKNEDLWTLPAAVLFAFSAVTTIGKTQLLTALSIGHWQSTKHAGRFLPPFRLW